MRSRTRPTRPAPPARKPPTPTAPAPTPTATAPTSAFEPGLLRTQGGSVKGVRGNTGALIRGGAAEPKAKGAPRHFALGGEPATTRLRPPRGRATTRLGR